MKVSEGSAGHQPVEALQVLQVGEVDGHAPTLGPHLDLDPSLEMFREQILEFEETWWSELRGRSEARAVELARTGGCVFQFVELGRPMFVLLNRLPKVGRHATFIDRILAVFESTAGEKQAVDTPRRRKVDVLVEPLTDRETEILELLEQRLIDKEIAAKLHISSSTVNSHCKNIYQKLEVSSRREAVARGTDLRILDDVRR